MPTRREQEKFHREVERHYPELIKIFEDFKKNLDERTSKKL